MSYQKSKASSSMPSNESQEIQGQVLKYPYAKDIQKLDTIKNLHSAIQARDQRIQQLQNQKLTEHSDFLIKQSSNIISRKFDQLIRNRQDASAKQIQTLKSQNSRLNQYISRIKFEKAGARSEIKISSFLESISSASEQAKMSNKAQILSLRSIKQTLQKQNSKLQAQLTSTKTEFINFQTQINADITQFTSRIEQERSKYDKLVIEMSQLNKKSSAKSEETKRMELQLEGAKKKSNQGSAALKEILSQISFVQSPNKLASYLNSIKGQFSLNEENKSKIKEMIKQNNVDIAKLKTKLQATEKQLIDQQTLCNEHQTSLNQKGQEIKRLSGSIEELKSKLQSQVSAKNALEIQKTKLSDTIIENQKNIKTLDESNKTKAQTISTLEKEKMLNIAKISEMSNRITQLEKNVKKQQTIINARNEQIDQLLKVKNSLTENTKNLERQKSNLSKMLEKLQKQKEQMGKVIFENTKKITALQKIQSDLTAEVTRNKKQISDLKYDLRIKKDENTKLASDLSEQKKRNSRLSQDLQKSEQQQMQSKQKIKDLQYSVQNINKSLIGQTSQFLLGSARIINNFKNINTEVTSILSEWKKSYVNIKFFSGSDIITRENISFVLSSLEQFMKLTPSSSKMVYKYDQLNMVNFHHYLDRIENLIVFIKLSNGTIIGGFTQYPIDPERIQKPGSGFLFSLTSKKVYKLRQEPKLPVVSYDSYYFIFGNAEIRLKSQEKKVFSNFGIANSTFDNGNDPRTKFLNVGQATNNELEIETYEFHRINFKQ